MKRASGSTSLRAARARLGGRWALVGLSCALLLWGGSARGKAAWGAEVEASRWQWDVQEDRSLALVGPDGPVWRLNFSPQQPKVFFDPLATVDGRSLTWNAPPDHAWHHGLWFSWKTINGVNYWEFDASGRCAGTTELRNVEYTVQPGQGAEVVMEFAYHPAGDTQVVMDEIVHVQVGMPQADGTYRIDWRQRTTARVDVRLDRTPPPGRPGGLEHGGYGGLSYRGAQKLADVVMTDSEGRRDMDVHRQTAKWLDASGRVDGRHAGVAILDHPKNPRHPTPWFVVRASHPHGPFWYTNPAFLCWEPYDLAAGETLTLAYRVLVHDGERNAKEIAHEWQQFAEQPHAP